MRLELVVGGGCEPGVPVDFQSWTLMQSSAHKTVSLLDDEPQCECSNLSCCLLYGHNWDKAPEGKNGFLHVPPAQQQGCLQSCSHFQDKGTSLRRALYAHDPVRCLYP